MSFVPRFFESVNVHLELEHMGGLPLFGRAIDPKGWQFAVKHVFDRGWRLSSWSLLAPVLAVAGPPAQLAGPGAVPPAPHRPRRPRLRAAQVPLDAPGHPRRCEMTTTAGQLAALPADAAPGGVEGDDRRTWVGTLMRSTSLDELPQLVNVLRGDMSLVGPRPERPEFVELFGSRIDRYEDRHRVKSGVTGWAQVHGLRGKTSLRDRVEWDNYYIENWSLGLDFKILVMTVAAILQRAE